MKYVVYDIETLCNCITFCFLDYETKKRKEFVLFNNIKSFTDLILFLRRVKTHNYWLVGFNCNNFDAQIIEKVFDLEGYEDINYIIGELYKEAQRVINLPEEEKYLHIIHESRFSIPHIDLYLQKHYNRMQKATSLKWLEFTMRRPIIKEMPIHHGEEISQGQIKSILEYNWEDVEATAEFFDKIMFETDLRISLSKKFDLKLINAPEPRLAREIFGKFLCKEMKITYKELKTKQTLRSKIHVKEILFPYIEFEDSNLNTLLTVLANTSLTPEQKFEYNLNVYGLECTFALGGLHSNNKPTVVTEDEDNIILTSDVASMYPNLAIQNDIKPAHLGNNFNKVYEFIYNERKKYDKKDPINYVYKIVLNSAYGLSAEKNSYLYDVAFTRAICLNGELSLLMLCERVKKLIPEVQFIMLNTDGIEVRIPKSKKDLYLQACSEWEKITKLVLEHGQYKKMVIRDVNNYIAIDIKDNVKKKGMFETEMDFHKNPSFLVVPKAIEAYFIHGTDYRTFIQEHDDVYDFMGAVKKKSNFELNLYYWNKRTNEIDNERGQRVTRFYVAKDGKSFFKDFNDGRRVSILADWLVVTSNEIRERDKKKIKDNIDYRYYITEVAKTIKDIEGNLNQLKLF